MSYFLQRIDNVTGICFEDVTEHNKVGDKFEKQVSAYILINIINFQNNLFSSLWWSYKYYCLQKVSEGVPETVSKNIEVRKAEEMKHEERKLAEMSIPKKNIRLYRKLKFMDKMNKKEVFALLF